MADRNRAERMLRFDMALTENGTSLTAPLRRAAESRGNIAVGVGDQIRHQGHPERDTRLWIVDRILEPQTIAHFLEFLFHGCLPNGKQSSFPRPTAEETMNITKPFSEWAPAPFNSGNRSTMEWMMIRIGSFEDGNRLQLIAKELHAMKSRVWEGIMPLSERRWKDLKLDEPENFGTACKYIVAVINVFSYLNEDHIRKALRETFNLISGHLKVYENAVNLARQQSATENTSERPQMTLLWHEFIKAKYEHITAKAHHWVTEHMQRLRQPILNELAIYEPANQLLMGYDETQWRLTDNLHDLGRNTSMADTVMFIPTDGYRGDPLPVQYDPIPSRPRGGFLETPITWSHSPHNRTQDYNTRVRFLSRREQYYDSDPMSQTPAQSLHVSARSQVTAQSIARRELRGEPKAPGKERWINDTLQAAENGKVEWGYIGYRLSHQSVNDDQWGKFVTAFDKDTSNWGLEYSDIDKIRDLCKVHWLDGKDLGIEDGDIDAAKKHFKDYIKSNGKDSSVYTDIFLVADAHVVNSYLEPKPGEGFVVVVDVDHDPEGSRNDESPGYPGRLRVLGSLLWDDLGAMIKMQTQHLFDLWPLAMGDVASVYRGPVTKAIYKTARRPGWPVEFPKEVIAICAIQAALKQLDLDKE